MSESKQKEQGFTLVEMLVALFIFALLSSSTLAVLTSTLRSKEQMVEKSEHLRQRTNARLLLKSDFASTLVVPKIDEFGQPETALFAGGALGVEHLLSLSRTGWENPGGLERRSDLQSVEYVLEGDVLTRKTSVRFNALASIQKSSQPLLSGLSSVKMQFYDGRDWLESWLTGPPPLGVSDLPKLASVEFVFLDGDTVSQIFWIGADQ